MSIRVATDVGGTFTDLVAYDPREAEAPSGGLRTLKVNSTPGGFEQGILDSVVRAEIPLSNVEFFAQGSTVVINALVARRGVRTGLITTRGFRDVLEIARCSRPAIFNYLYRKPEPFVPRYLRKELTERVLPNGNIEQPPKLAELTDIVADFRNEGVEAIAVCFLHSYANPAHEQRVVARLREMWPEIPVVTSQQISREWREYERTSTTVLCAYVQPIAERYLAGLEQGLRDKGLVCPVYVMQSNGGIDTAQGARQRPITLVESGPASGVLGAVSLGRSIGLSNLITLDIGGTTAKCSLIQGGVPKINTHYRIEHTRLSPGYPILAPVIDIVEIGNGGGSIAKVDDLGRLRVGPQSAGADPGPAAYGRGGTDPTTADANLLSGRIDPRQFQGTLGAADLKSARAAMASLGDRLGSSIEQVARGILRIANNNMTNALKLVSINRGYDPRDFTLIAFGGGGPLHAIELARDLHMTRVIIPRLAAVFSAWGMLMCDLRRDYIRTRITPLTADAGTVIRETFGELESAAVAEYVSEGIPAERISFLRLADIRYRGQEHTVKTDAVDGEISAAAIVALRRQFSESYKREYGYTLDVPEEIVSYHVAAVARVERPEPRVLPCSNRRVEQARYKVADRAVDFGEQGTVLTPSFQRSLLEPGMKIHGPAVIDEVDTVTVVGPSDSLIVDDFGNLDISIGR